MTPAVTLLESAGVAHDVQTYEHDPNTESFGLEAARTLGLDPATVFKTLVAVVDRSEPVVALVPVAAKLDLKSLARAAGAKKAAMAERTDAERITGYVAGGISPLGQRRKLRTFVDATADGLDLINVSGGRRGLEIRLCPTDLIILTEATVHPLATGD